MYVFCGVFLCVCVCFVCVNVYVCVLSGSGTHVQNGDLFINTLILIINAQTQELNLNQRTE